MSSNRSSRDKENHPYRRAIGGIAIIAAIGLVFYASGDCTASPPDGVKKFGNEQFERISSQFAAQFDMLRKKDTNLADWFARSFANTALEAGTQTKCAQTLRLISAEELRRSSVLDCTEWLRKRQDGSGLQIISDSLPPGRPRDRVYVDLLAVVGRSSDIREIRDLLNKIEAPDLRCRAAVAASRSARETKRNERAKRYRAWGEELLVKIIADDHALAQPLDTKVTRGNEDQSPDDLSTETRHALQEFIAEAYQSGDEKTAEAFLKQVPEFDRGQVIEEIACSDAVAGNWERAFQRFKAETGKKHGPPILDYRIIDALINAGRLEDAAKFADATNAAGNQFTVAKQLSKRRSLDEVIRLIPSIDDPAFPDRFRSAIEVEAATRLAKMGSIEAAASLVVTALMRFPGPNHVDRTMSDDWTATLQLAASVLSDVGLRDEALRALRDAYEAVSLDRSNGRIDRATGVCEKGVR
jgi:hypothetical protein